MKLSTNSQERLKQCHPDLKKIVELAVTKSDIEFQVTEVLRSLARQQELVKLGASKTMKSRHLPHPKDGLSRAVDLVAMDKGKVNWSWPLYDKLAKAMKEAAAELNIPIEWGGDWRSFKDGPHFQLPWKQYP